MKLGSQIKRMVSWIAPWALVVKGRAGLPGAIAITFDDGPHPVNTPRILEALAFHGAKATFFLQGSLAEQYPELVREIATHGHQIGNHGYHHMDAKAVSTHDYVADVMRAQAALEKIVGSELPRDFRPPFGNIAVGPVIALLRRRFRFVFWSHDSRDSYLRDTRVLLDYISKQSIPTGSIILLHEDYAHTTEILPNVLTHLQRNDVRITSVADLLSNLPN